MEDGYYKDKVDGIVGTNTRKALKAFQAAQGLNITGKLDTKTASRLGIQ
jgi:peptidoglycan hydrolase-like protein with peptidoglycan-binding domain